MGRPTVTASTTAAASAARYSSPYTAPGRRGASITAQSATSPRSTGMNPASSISPATTRLASASPQSHWTTRPSPVRPAALAWKPDVSVLNDLVYRAPGIRAALKDAAVCPRGGAGVPNWLVVSITIFPVSGPAWASASGIALHGTDTTTTSPN